MSKGLSSRDKTLLVFLVVLLVGVVYYLGYYQPYQTDMQSIQSRCDETDLEITTAQAKLDSMDAMQAELDEIFSQPEDQITEIAPYDNAKVVMSQLNSILAASEEYSLSFKDPAIGDDGTVRRVVSMSFSCSDYASAKQIIENLSSSHWRCLITTVAVSTDEDDAEPDGSTMFGPISVQATLTFFESTKIA
jgi:hypothetical protein